jgi:hypothetical protein
MSSCTIELKHCITSAFVFDLNYNAYIVKKFIFKFEDVIFKF